MLRARVTDLAGALAPADAARLEAKLAAFERETSHQLAVLLVPTLGGEPIESFALRVAERAQLGQRGIDNGMLLVLAVQDHRARVEVGYGLEGAVPDAVAKRVLEDVIFPRLRAGDLAGGVDAGVEALMRAARGEVVPEAKRPSSQDLPTARGERVPEANGPSSQDRSADRLAAVLLIVLWSGMIWLPLRARWLPLRPRRRGTLSALLGGATSGGIAWLIFASLGWALLAAVLGALFAAWSPIAAGSRRWGRFPPGSGGWGGGLGGGGFGGGGGGFSGGGGGFGGGGASGSW